jgi:hypothetical protein
MGGQDLLVLLCGAWLEVTVRQPPRRVRVEAGARDPGGAGFPQPAVDLTPAVNEPCLSNGSFREGVRCKNPPAIGCAVGEPASGR